MIKADLWQAEEGPRWRVELGPDDELVPETFAKLARAALDKWEVWRMIVFWRFREDKLRARVCVDARKVVADPDRELRKLAGVIARDALRLGLEEFLPRQFFPETGLVGPDGRPLRRENLH